MAVTATISTSVNGSFTSTADTAISGTPTYPFAIAASAAYSSGTGAGQVDRVYAKTLTLAASATADLDLAGSLVDIYGATITIAKLKAVFVQAAAANTNNVQVTRPASNGVPWLMAAGDGIALRPGAWVCWGSGTTDASGVAVTAGTGDLITFTNSAGSTSVTYTVVLLGTSA